MSIFDHAITVRDVLLFGAGWFTLGALRAWRSIAVRHSTDGGAEGRRLRAQQGPQS